MTEAAGEFNDGKTALRHLVNVGLDDHGLLISNRVDAGQRHWPFDRLRAVDPPKPGMPLRLTCTDEPDARLRIDQPQIHQALRQRAPHLYARGVARPKVRRTILVVALIICGLALFLWQGVPRLSAPLAHMIPLQWEEDIGLVVRDHILGGADLCQGEAGQAALSQLTERLLAKAERPAILTISVADRDMVNAFAMPGGQIVIMRGLIEATEAADEVAAVLAHEIGHVHHRHPTQLAIRAAGLGLLGKMITGDGSFLVEVAGELGGFLLLLGYTRDMERQADTYGRELLLQAGLSSEAMVRFFRRLGDNALKSDNDVLSYFSSHPPLQERIAAADGDGPRGRALDPAAWKALREICD